MDKRRFPVVPVIAVLLKVMAVGLLAVLAFDFFSQFTQFSEQMKEANKVMLESPDLYKAQIEAFKNAGYSRLGQAAVLALLAPLATWGVSDLFLALREIEFNTRRPSADSVELAEEAPEEETAAVA